MTTNTRSKSATISGVAVIVAAILVAVTITGAVAQSPMAAPAYAPAPALDCMTALYNMSDCLTFVTAGSNLTKPDTPCCGELAGLVEGNPICLCQLLGNPGATGFEIDRNKALSLPNVCGVSTPPVSTCAAVGVPVGALTPSEAPGASSGPGSAASPGPTPGSDNSNNGISSNAVFDMSIFIGLAIAFFTLFL